jgi:hypothetical protein
MIGKKLRFRAIDSLGDVVGSLRMQRGVGDKDGE